MSTKTLLSILFIMAMLLSACGGEGEEPAGNQAENAESAATAVAEPEEASATQEEALATQEEALATQEEASATPEEASATPEEASATPEEASATPEEASATEVVVAAESTTPEAFEEATEAAVEDENIDAALLESHLESVAYFQEAYGDFELSSRCFEDQGTLEVLDPGDGGVVFEESPFPVGIPTLRFDYFSETDDQFYIYVGGRYVDGAYEGDPLAICIEAASLDPSFEVLSEVEDNSAEIVYPSRVEFRSALNRVLDIEGDPAVEALWLVEGEGLSLDELVERLSPEFPDVVDAFGPDALRYGVRDVLLEMLLVDFELLTDVDANQVKYVWDIDEFDADVEMVRKRGQAIGLDEEGFLEGALGQWLQYQPLYFAIEAATVDGLEEGFAFVSAVIDPRITDSKQVDEYRYSHQGGSARMNFLRINTDRDEYYVRGVIYPKNNYNYRCADDPDYRSYSEELYERTPLSQKGKIACSLINKGTDRSATGYFMGEVTASGPATYAINAEWTAVVEGNR